MKVYTQRLWLVVVMMSLVGSSWAGNVYVDCNATGSADGSSWADAYTTIQDGIDGATGGDTVIVAEGTYTEQIDFGGLAITVTSTDPCDPCIIAATIIDGDANGSVVTFDDSETSSSVLEGVTITNGDANYGGGIYCYGASPTISKCLITGSAATINGGGIYMSNSSSTISSCQFTDNDAGDNGGAIYNSANGDITVTDCLFEGNYAFSRGGAVMSTQSGADFSDCTFTENSVVYLGGAVANHATGSSPGISFSHCIFDGNYTTATTTNGGGAMSNFSCDDVDLINCLFVNNDSACEGGAILNYDSTLDGSVVTITNSTLADNMAGNVYGGGIYAGSSDASLTNCLLYDNEGSDGGAMYGYNGDLTLINCTLSGNTSTDGEGVYLDSATADLDNCIFWDNGSYAEIYLDTSTVGVDYCDLEGGQTEIGTTGSCTINWGSGNIDSDPCFVDVGNDIYDLDDDSPCIDAANGNVASDRDLLNNGRNDVQSVSDTGTGTPTYVDMGAMEYIMPLVYLTMDDNQSNSTVTDDTGNGFNGILNDPDDDPGDTTTEHNDPCGVFDGALTFDGTDDYIVVSDNDALDGFDSFTISLWFKFTGSSLGTLISKGTAYSLRTTAPSSGVFTLYTSLVFSGGADSFYSLTIDDDDAWHHVALVYDGSQVKLYVDGCLYNTVSANGTIVANAYNLQLGKLFSASNYYQGSIDDVQLYNTALSERAILNLYDSGN